ncbi:hypothetical protein EVAR_87107_1 [Eumeta japonica]|uniref:Uncharacterized protein n=1 Tax=Eumeta variegata TaxID=151549 RepID=A0A4C1TJW5_EUMVA|nr:hypothetical protein EVAR_87107_1 [Eumeta japonica]
MIIISHKQISAVFNRSGEPTARVSRAAWYLVELHPPACPQAPPLSRRAGQRSERRERVGDNLPYVKFDYDPYSRF